MHIFRVLDIKTCMNCMLRREDFDDFLLSEASITTGISCVIDGHLTEGFYTPEELETMGLSQERCMRYEKIRPLCFDMIKGRRTPQSFQFVFLASGEQIRDFLKKEQILLQEREIANLSLNVRFFHQELAITCPVTLNTFTLDKTVEQAWERWICAFMKERGIALEQIG